MEDIMYQIQFVTIHNRIVSYTVTLAPLRSGPVATCGSTKAQGSNEKDALSKLAGKLAQLHNHNARTAKFFKVR
jgi:hypothetical protein